MENNYHDNELDRWLREHAEAGGDVPATDGWDQPSEMVWSNLRAGLDARRKQRRGFWLLFFALGFGLLTSGVIYWQWTDQPAVPAPQTGPVAETQPNLNQVTNTPQSNLTLPTTTDKTKTTLLPAASAAPSPSTKSELPDLYAATQTNKHTNTATPVVRRETSGQTMRTAPQPDPEPAVKLAQAPDPAQVPDTPEGQHGTQAGSEQAQMHEPEVEAMPGQIRAVPLATVLPTIPTAYLSAPPRPEPAKISLPANAAKPHQTGWYANAATGMFFTSRRLKTESGQQPNGTESGAWTHQYGLQAGFQLSQHWSLETGIQRSAVRLNAERQISFQYRTDLEQFNHDRYLYQSSTDQAVQTSFGEVEMRMDMGREVSRPILNLANIQVVLRTDEQVQYLRIPFLVHYRVGKGPWTWSLSTGLGLNFETGYEMNMTAARVNRPGVRDLSARARQRASGLAPLMLDAQFGAGLHYRLAPSWSLLLSPQFRYGITPINNQGPVRSYAVSSGLQLSLTYQFK